MQLVGCKIIGFEENGGCRVTQTQDGEVLRKVGCYFSYTRVNGSASRALFTWINSSNGYYSGWIECKIR